jgi:hypothetical protein
MARKVGPTQSNTPALDAVRDNSDKVVTTAKIINAPKKTKPTSAHISQVSIAKRFAVPSRTSKLKPPSKRRSEV